MTEAIDFEVASNLYHSTLGDVKRRDQVGYDEIISELTLDKSRGTFDRFRAIERFKQMAVKAADLVLRNINQYQQRTPSLEQMTSEMNRSKITLSYTPAFAGIMADWLVNEFEAGYLIKYGTGMPIPAGTEKALGKGWFGESGRHSQARRRR